MPFAATLVLVTVVMAYYQTPTTYRDNYREPKYVNAGTVWWVVFLLIAFSIPALIVAAERFGSKPWEWWTLSPMEHQALRRVMIVLFLLTMAGYLIWLANAASHGFHFSAVSRMFAGTQSADKTKQTLKTVSGVTTMTQFGIPLVVIGALLWPKAGKDVRIMTAVVVALGAFRAYVGSERLALYEIVVPIGVVVAARAYNGPGTASTQIRRRLAVRALPFVAVPVLILTFAGYEYSRSWQWWKDRTHDSFMVFEAKRLAGYYTTSYNNAEMLRTTHSWPPPGAVPFMTWNAFWTFPILRNVVPYKQVSNGNDFYTVYSDALDRYANPEFNLITGITNPTFDYGVIGGGIYTAVFGAVVGATYAAFAQRRRYGLLFYPIIMIGLVEWPREGYLTVSRSMPALAAALVAACVLRRVRHHERRLAAERTGAHGLSKLGIGPRQDAVPQLGSPPAPA